MTDRISLEKEAVAFSDANAPHPRIYELAPEEGRVFTRRSTRITCEQIFRRY